MQTPCATPTTHRRSCTAPPAPPTDTPGRRAPLAALTFTHPTTPRIFFAMTESSHIMAEHGIVSRRSLFRVGGIGLAAIAFGPALTACSRTEDTVTLDSLREQGYIQVAINNEAPFGYIDENGEVTGSSPELLRGDPSRN